MANQENSFKGFRIRDLFYLLIFPALITALMFLPASIRTILKLNLKDPRWWQYFTSAFIHNNLYPHLSLNIIAYFVLVIPLFILVCSRTNKKRDYYKIMFFIILSFPIISSVLQVLIFNNTYLFNLDYSCGSSGIIAALAGIIPAFWILSLSKKDDFKIKRIFYFLILFYVIWFFVFSYENSILVKLVFSAMLFALLLFYLKGLYGITLEIKKEFKENWLVGLIFIFLSFIFLIFPGFLYPSTQSLLNGTSHDDFLVHFFGLAYGVIVSFTFFIFADKKRKNKSPPKRA